MFVIEYLLFVHLQLLQILDVTLELMLFWLRFSRNYFCGYTVASTSLNLLLKPAIKLSQERKL